MKIFILFLIIIPSIAFAHGGGEIEAAKIGKGVVAFDEHDGFKLSQEAQNRMKFQYKKFDTTGSFSIPKEALVQVLGDNHIYLHTNDFFKAIDVEIVSKFKDSYVIRSTKLQIGTEVVVKGVNFLRVIDMDLSAGEDEHEEKDEHKNDNKEEHHD